VPPGIPPKALKRGAKKMAKGTWSAAKPDSPIFKSKVKWSDAGPDDPIFKGGGVISSHNKKRQEKVDEPEQEEE